MPQYKYFYENGKITKRPVAPNYRSSYNSGQPAPSPKQGKAGTAKTKDKRTNRMIEQFDVKTHNSAVWSIVFAILSAAALVASTAIGVLSYDIIAIVLILAGPAFLFAARSRRYKNLLRKALGGAKPVPKMEPSNSVTSLEKQAKEYLQYIKNANDDIPSEELSADINEIEKLTAEIFDYAIQNKNDKRTLRRFFSYYMPTTLKLLNTYVELEKIPIQTQQIIDSKNEIAAMLKKIKTAFAALYEDIMQAKAMDISTEISAMEKVMGSEGLIDPIELDMKEYRKVYDKEHEK